MTGFIARDTNLLGEGGPIGFKRFVEFALKLGCMHFKKVQGHLAIPPNRS
jgi:hypothetical protein